jgi:hypothetical protein
MIGSSGPSRYAFLQGTRRHPAPEFGRRPRPYLSWDPHLAEPPNARRGFGGVPAKKVTGEHPDLYDAALARGQVHGDVFTPFAR